MTYKPNPLDTSNAILGPEIVQLTELLAKNAHENWAKQRMDEGWSNGPRPDDLKKEHPSLVDYERLPESEKQYDRITAMETLKAIVALGYKISK